METTILEQSKVEDTVQLINSLEYDEILNIEGGKIYLQYLEYGDINYERKSDWMRLINKIDKYDYTPIKRILIGDKKASNWGGAKLSLSDTSYSEDSILIEFDEPKKVIIKTINDSFITVTAKKLKGLISHEWYFKMKGHEDLNGYAGCLDIFIEDVKIVE